MSPRRRSGKKIDFVHWTYSSGTNEMGAGTAALTLFPAEHEPQTLLRIRGNFRANGLGGLTGSIGAFCGVGVILVPEGTGSTVLWSPISDGDAPWIWVDVFSLSYEEPVLDTIAITDVYRSVIDNKAMRITRNQEVQLVFENVTNEGAMTVSFNYQARHLTGK